MQRRNLILALVVLALGLYGLSRLAGPGNDTAEPTLPDTAPGLDRVVFGTNWKAEAEHGGYYQALATGLYRAAGLDVTIRQGGPQVNHSQLMAAGRIDFNMGGNIYQALNYVMREVPVVTIAAMFQKDPQVLIAHEGAGIEGLADMKGRPMMIGNDGRLSFWQWLKSAYGFEDSQLRPYNFNVAPFLADREAVQQGYVTSEPIAIRQAGAMPKVFLLADYGFKSYSTTLETSASLIERDPDLVQRFVDASIRGWQSYLHGDPTPAHEIIKRENPEITEAQLRASRRAMIDYGIVDSGDAETLGIGAMTDARWRAFFEEAAAAGVYPRDLDYRKAYTLRFVNKGVGLDEAPGAPAPD